ncbi:MAG: CDP-glucose 4,6-dehydratase [Flavisolibacter sp.]
MENVVTFEKLSSFYRDKKVFVTGHTGFKGSWLTACLNLLGARVKGYALPPEYDNGLFTLMKSIDIGESVLSDIRNKQQLLEEIERFRPDHIFHLAAQPLVRRSYQIPAETFEVNVVGTANLLEVVSKLNHTCTVVVITTDKVYENRETNVFYKEDDILGGYDPYSASKACTELVVSSFRNSFFKRQDQEFYQKAIASVRAGNVIGGGDWSQDRIIPDIVGALKRGQVIPVRSPKSVRPWQHVLEPIGGYLLLGGLLGQDSSFSKAYNFGPEPEDHLTVQKVVETAIQTWGAGKWEDCSSSLQLHEASLLQLSIERAKNELHWQPKLDAKTAIEWTIDWYKQPDDVVVDYTFDQIRTYFAL